LVFGKKRRLQGESLARIPDPNDAAVIAALEAVFAGGLIFGAELPGAGVFEAGEFRG
jgi:hypothetical protein